MILRHDVDYSTRKAHEMAKLEQALGVRSTYFVLFSSPYYNLLTGDAMRAVRDIAGMGHEIGLHYDTDLLTAADDQGRSREVAALAKLLGAQVGTPVTSIAQHNPSETQVRLQVAGYIDAYSDRFCRDIAYLSDSRRLFGAPDPYAFFREHSRSQLLIHPLWWHETVKSRRESFDAVRNAILEATEAMLVRINGSMEADEIRRQQQQQ